MSPDQNSVYSLDPEYVQLAEKVYNHVNNVHEYYNNGEVLKEDTELELAKICYEQMEGLEDMDKW